MKGQLKSIMKLKGSFNKFRKEITGPKYMRILGVIYKRTMHINGEKILRQIIFYI